ncbi:unnamed protein product, partial [Wuchereria bancrofti]
MAQLLSSANSCSYQSACTQLQYPSIHPISSNTTDQSVLPFGACEIRKSDMSTSKPTLEQLRNSFALPIVSSNSNLPSLSTQSTSYHYDHCSQQLQPPQQQPQQPSQQFSPLYLGIPGGPSTDTTTMIPSQNCCSASLPTTMEQFTHAAAAVAAAAA